MQKDKLLHFLAGALIALVVALTVAPWFAVLAAGVAGLAKEAYDHISGKGTVELADFGWTLTGGVYGIGVAALALDLVRILFLFEAPL